ncbi:MAG: hypothetical protein LGL72_18305 [Acidibrevibacterium sp.]|jgi:DNA-binding transcriptional regulator LsrR (DeoR family)|uniref:sugar-binding transcriptional regulator n=1 Tax=Acidibrevibacterium fodinaquatile TaxID=1969806 RepID=UPI0023A8FE9C|nr:sugar-binding domain-containing protein [Acidibrevibacterium fodinaquatile]MCA7121296.1 hypothetical protein [Acidibrevibacterium fodinaquatile]
MCQPDLSRPMPLHLGQEPDEALIVRAAWLYHLVGKTQEEVAAQLGLHRSRVVRLLAEARERGLVSVSIHHDSVRDLEIERMIASRFGLDFCFATMPTGLSMTANEAIAAAQGVIARRAVGSAAASLLRGRLAQGRLTVGVSWGRTLEQVALHLTGARNPDARFVSLMGSLSHNSASNTFEVVQAFAARTSGEGHFLPIPFIADSIDDRAVLLSQRSVAAALDMAHNADLYLISVGELSETSLLRQRGMIAADELAELRRLGAVCDTLGLFFDAQGRRIDHPLSRRALAVDFQRLIGRDVVLLGAGIEKVTAVAALLRTGVARGLVIDGDAARLLALEG